MFNGELFDHVERRAELAARGHRLVTGCDTEIIPHLYEDAGQDVFERLRGQFAVALWDEKQRTSPARAGPVRHLSALLDAAGETGCCSPPRSRRCSPRAWCPRCRTGAASTICSRSPRCRARERAFEGDSTPGRGPFPPGRPARTATAGSGEVSGARLLGRWISRTTARKKTPTTRARSWTASRNLLLAAVEKRLRADVPVGSYLSGGVDSSVIAALACKLKGSAINTYTVRVDSPGLGRTRRGQPRRPPHRHPASHRCRSSATADAVNTYPQLIEAAESPVVDTSCAALLQLARRVHDCGQRVVLTGEGADEWLVGYPWYKGAKLLGLADVIPGLPLSDLVRRAYLRLNKVPQFPAPFRRRAEDGHRRTERLDRRLRPLRVVQSCASTPRRCARSWKRPIPGRTCKSRWNGPNAGTRSIAGIWVAGRVTLAGHLLQAKGDRVAMHSSVEVRYPFLDEDVFDFLARLHPRWKLRGLRDKHLLRLLAERWVPPAIYRRKKAIFRAPLDSFPRGPRTDVRRATSQRGVAAPHRLFRRAGRAPLAAGVPPDARRFAAAVVGGDGF